jgi:hypothetical protein
VGRDGNEDLIGAFQVITGEEAVWRNVILWTVCELWHQTVRDAPAVLAQLQADYREHFGRDAELGVVPVITPLPGTSPYPPGPTSSQEPGVRNFGNNRISSCQ